MLGKGRDHTCPTKSGIQPVSIEIYEAVSGDSMTSKRWMAVQKCGTHRCRSTSVFKGTVLSGTCRADTPNSVHPDSGKMSENGVDG